MHSSEEIRYELNSSDSRQDPVAGFCAYGDQHSGSIKIGEFHDWPVTCQLRKKKSALWNDR
jgi:hypothetical protein